MLNTAPPAPAPEFLRGPDSARFLGVSYSHFRALVRKGEGPPSVPLGRAKLFSVHSLREFMRARER